MDQITQKRLLRRGEVEKIAALRRSSIYAKVASGSFPAPVKIGRLRWSRLVGQGGGRVKVYSGHPIMPPESCLS